MIASPALHPHGTHRPELIEAATWAPKALRPAKPEQIIPVGLLGSEQRLEIAEISWILFHNLKHYRLWLPESGK